MSIILEKYEKALFHEIFINKEYSVLEKRILDAKTIFDIGGHI
jgi:hypothetical protein